MDIKRRLPIGVELVKRGIVKEIPFNKIKNPAETGTGQSCFPLAKQNLILPPHSLKNSPEPLCFRRASVTWRNRRSLLGRSVCSALQLRRDFPQMLFYRFPPSRLSGKTYFPAYLLRHRL